MEIDDDVLTEAIKKQPGCTGDAWYIEHSPVGGRGLFADRDLSPGDLIFIDTPIVVGPRWKVGGGRCTVCLEWNRPLSGCFTGCRMPVCTSCDHSKSPECEILHSLGITKSSAWSPDLYRALAPIRCLHLSHEDAAIVRQLQANTTSSPEIDLIKSYIERDLTSEEEIWLTHCCRVLDSVAFEIPFAPAGSITSPTLRGLYPLAGLLNHSCTPNTRNYSTGKDCELVFVASVPISKGEEIFTSYCPTLWGTQLRNQFLEKTKQFKCSCQRCLHPTEFDTYLSGLECQCGGVIMPKDGRNVKSPWHCLSCDKEISLAQASLSAALLAAGKTVLSGIKLPASNYISIQTGISSILETTDIQSLSNEQLEEQINKIKYYLSLQKKLNLGDNRTKGLLYYSLFKNFKQLQEIHNINLSTQNQMDMKQSFQEAKRILSNDISVSKSIINNLKIII